MPFIRVELAGSCTNGAEGVLLAGRPANPMREVAHAEGAG